MLNRISTRVTFLWAATLWGATLLCSATAADLPVRKVVLYKHGIGFFERAGEIPAGDSARLEFRANEMDDVLKSLTIVVEGGAVTGVRYDSSEPLERKLEQFPFRVGEAQPLSRILDQFKGARLELRFAREPVEGTIVSSRTIPATNQQPERHRLVLLMDNGELRTVDPAAAAGIRFVDPKWRQQFQDYLQLIAGSRNRDKRSVTIEASGQPRTVTARYVVPAPAWKSSYRLIFDQNSEPMLEGWAIVDNTSGEDWSNVTLSLVSGMPVSFISRLYAPRHVQRSVFELSRDRAQRPVIYGGAVGGAEEEALPAQAGNFRADLKKKQDMAMSNEARLRGNRREMAQSRLGMLEKSEAPAGFGGGRGAGVGAAFYEPAALAPSSLAATATASELGELFEYRIDRPVTVKQSESAMLPFLQQRIEARKLLIYNEADGSQHPRNAVELTNNTGITLDGGPVTVIEAGAYGGESLFETIPDGDKRLISYAVDLGVRITTAFDSSRKLQSKFTLRRGLLTTSHAVREVRTHTIHNVDERAKTIIIERPARPGYKPVEPAPTEKTATSYRYEVNVAPGTTEKFAIVEERMLAQSIAVTNLTYDRLIVFVRNEELDSDGRAKLGRIADAKREIADLQRDIQQLEQDIQQLFQDQERLRRNISSLRSVTGQQQQVQLYAQKLATQEGELVSMRDRKSDAERRRNQAQTELNRLIETLEI